MAQPGVVQQNPAQAQNPQPVEVQQNPAQNPQLDQQKLQIPILLFISIIVIFTLVSNYFLVQLWSILNYNMKDLGIIQSKLDLKSYKEMIDRKNKCIEEKQASSTPIFEQKTWDNMTYAEKNRYCFLQHKSVLDRDNKTIELSKQDSTGQWMPIKQPSHWEEDKQFVIDHNTTLEMLIEKGKIKYPACNVSNSEYVSQNIRNGLILTLIVQILTMISVIFLIYQTYKTNKEPTIKYIYIIFGVLSICSQFASAVFTGILMNNYFPFQFYYGINSQNNKLLEKNINMIDYMTNKYECLEFSSKNVLRDFKNGLLTAFISNCIIIMFIMIGIMLILS